ncbi:TPA: hypothetical protein ACNP4C_005217 [Klebsiella oxytoca]|uniref:hypothetical protein n=1 Tax=Klebsiella oxytoca TaxID=571 RepID=UPI00375153F0
MKAVSISLCIVTLFSSSVFSASENDKGFNEFVECSKATAIKYSPLQESAEVIAKTAVYSCTHYQIAGLKKTQEFKNLDAERQMEFIRRSQEAVEPMAMKAVMDYRLSKIK